MNDMKVIRIAYIQSLNILKSSKIGREDIIHWSTCVLLSMKNRRLNFALDGVYFFGENPVFQVPATERGTIVNIKLAG